MGAEQVPEQRIPREDIKIIELHVGEKVVKMSRLDATIYSFYQPWSHMRHIYYKPEGQNPTYYFNLQDEVLLAAAQAHLSEIKQAEPSDGDVDAYQMFQHYLLERELSPKDSEG